MNKNFFAEALGSFFFILVILMSQKAGINAAFAIAGALTFCIYAFGQVSGGHFNPAVSIAAVVRGVLPKKELPYYIGAQILGGLVAVLVAYYFSQLPELKYNLPIIKPAIATNVIPTIIVEFVMTFALCMTVLMVATSPKTKDNSYFGLAIGLVVMGGALVFASISGAAFNPAVAFSLTITNLQSLKIDHILTLVYAYILPQALAGMLAGLAYKLSMEEFTVKVA